VAKRADGAAASPTLASALDACFEPVAGWQRGVALPQATTSLARGGARPRLPSPRELVLLALDELELFATRALWSRRPPFVLARRTFATTVAMSIVVAIAFLFVAGR